MVLVVLGGVVVAGVVEVERREPGLGLHLRCQEGLLVAMVFSRSASLFARGVEDCRCGEEFGGHFVSQVKEYGCVDLEEMDSQAYS